ncbi:MAG: hypothetical protein ACOVOB_02050, partial [Brevundimonas sp.]
RRRAARRAAPPPRAGGAPRPPPAAGVLGEAVVGASAAEVIAARDALAAMLKAGGEGPAGRFEGLRALRQVADYPARHASTLVALEATVKALEAAGGAPPP